MSQNQNYFVVIKVVGVGGGGVNVVNCMIDFGFCGVEFIVVNIDVQVLFMSDVDVKFDVGCEFMCGFGVGVDFEVGCCVVEDYVEEIEQVFIGVDMVFVIVGEGGGMGIGGVFVVVCIVKLIGVFMIGVVMKLFLFEGCCCQSQVEVGVVKFKEEVDIFIVVLNDCLFEISDCGILMIEVFVIVDQVFFVGVQGIMDFIMILGFINFDFVDVKLVMQGVGFVLMGIGLVCGVDCVIKVVEFVVELLLFEVLIEGVYGVLLLIQGGLNFGIFEIYDVVDFVKEVVYFEVNIIFGIVIDDMFGDEVCVMVIVVGFDGGEFFLCFDLMVVFCLFIVSFFEVVFFEEFEFVVKSVLVEFVQFQQQCVLVMSIELVFVDDDIDIFEFLK